MKYTVNHPEKNYAKALGLSNTQINNIKYTIKCALQEIRKKNTNTADQMTDLMAPFLHTPEEAYFAASIIFTSLGLAIAHTADDPTGETPFNPN